DLTGECAFSLPVHVLRGDGDLGPGEQLNGDGEGDERRAYDDVDAVELLLTQAEAELGRPCRPLVHLPVAGNQHLRLRDGCDTRQLLALEQLERGAASGREPGDVVGESELGQRARRVGAADDRMPVRAG